MAIGRLKCIIGFCEPFCRSFCISRSFSSDYVIFCQVRASDKFTRIQHNTPASPEWTKQKRELCINFIEWIYSEPVHRYSVRHSFYSNYYYFRSLSFHITHDKRFDWRLAPLFDVFARFNSRCLPSVHSIKNIERARWGRGAYNNGSGYICVFVLWFYDCLKWHFFSPLAHLIGMKYNQIRKPCQK